MAPREQLNERAKTQCTNAMQLLLDAPTFLTEEDESSEWSPILRRNIFEQTFVVWHACNAIECRVDAEGRVVSFLDRKRSEPETPPELTPLKREEVLQIAATSGWVGPDAEVDHMIPGLKNMLTAVITQEQPGMPSSIAFTINPAARHVAAFSVIKF